MTIANNQLIRDALGLINVLGVGEAAEPEHSELGIRTLNALLADWEAAGVNLQYYAQTMDDLGSDCPIPDDAELAVKYYLAFALAAIYGKQVSPDMVALGATYYARLTRDGVLLRMREATLTNLPQGSGRRIRGDIING